MSLSSLHSSIATTLLAAVACVAPTPFTVQLSVDNAADPAIKRCLANADGVVARFTDEEAYVAVDPNDAARVVSIWQTRSGSGSVVQFSHSSDAGRRWSAPRAVPINACAGGPVAAASRAADPWVSIGPDGRWYLSAIAFTPGQGNAADLANALVVAASTDDGATWLPPVAMAIAPTPNVSHDNLAITADPTRPGFVYAATTLIETPDAQTYFGRLGFTRTIDGGQTWEPIRPLSPAVNGERIGAPQIAVDPRSGRLFAVYHARVQGDARIGVRISDDQGATWSAEMKAATHVRGARVEHPTGTRFVFADDIVQAVVSPRDGRVLIAYADARRTGGQQYGISLVWSADGRQWSEPAAVSDDAERTSWLPAIAVTEDGDVGVTYHSADFGAAPANDRRVRVHIRRFSPSASGYAHTATSQLIEDVLAWPGDYQGLTTVRGGFLAVFGRTLDITAAFVPR